MQKQPEFLLDLMRGEALEQWQRLCHQAAAEQDPDCMLELTREILRMLTDKSQRLQSARSSSATLSRKALAAKG